MIFLFNTLTRKKELFKPLKKGSVNLYTCGPTVYNHAHIGNLRSYIVADSLKRVLEYNGIKVKWAMNITDIDDKTIAGAVAEFGNRAGLPELKKFTQKYIDSFLSDLEAVGVSASKIKFIKVTEIIPKVQEFIISLMKKGYAYKADDGSVYFSIEKYQNDFNDYGRLAGPKFMAGKKIGARIKSDEYDKENLSDFALWKAREKQDANIFWDHPVLGPGRPGWHIECSVANKIAFAGKATDIHTGGIDLVFPHHTNEIAQSQPIYLPFVDLWCHCEHLLVEGKKMSKSLGNVVRLADLKARSPLAGSAFRHLALQTHYRKQMNFTWDSFFGSVSFIEKLSLTGKPKLSDDRKKFLKALNSDMNLSLALSVFKSSPAKEFAEVLGLNVDKAKSALPKPDKKVLTLLNEREKARKSKDWAKSDALRDQISQLGWAVEDTGKGSVLKPLVKPKPEG